MNSFFTTDPKVAYFLAGSFVVVVGWLVRFGWQQWVEHETKKANERQHRYLLEQEKRLSAAASVGADPINWPPNLNHKQPWKDKRFIA